MDQVLLNRGPGIVAEVPANGAWQCRGGIGGASQSAKTLNDSMTLGDHCNDRARKHELHQGSEEGLADMFGVMRLQHGPLRVDHAQVNDPIALSLDARDHFADKLTANSVGLDQDQGAFNAHDGRKSSRGRPTTAAAGLPEQLHPCGPQ